jgi:hypothetical protein
VAWVSLNSLTQAGGAGPLGIEMPGVDNFDSIVYAERTTKQWMNGSSGWGRSVGDNGGAQETLTTEVMMAIAYDTDNSIKIYRNGVRYDSNANQGSLVTRVSPRAIIGRRIFSNGPSLQGSVNEARFYNVVLTPAEIETLAVEGPNGGTLSITNATPTNVTATTASLNGVLNAPGWSFDVYVYYGTVDGTNNEGGLWQNSAFVGTYTNAVSTNLAKSITLLAPETPYYWTFSAQNVVTNLWASPSKTFTTLAGPPPPQTLFKFR